MASQERREFDKYLKFFTLKATQVVVQSRQGRKIRTKSTVQGNDWFNLAIPEDKQVTAEMKRSLEGKLPQPELPCCTEILMETPEGDTVILEVWQVSVTHRRDVGVSVAHLLYPRLSLMLKSLVAVSRSTPAYRLSRQQEEELKFTFRVYLGVADIQEQLEEFKHVRLAETSCPYGSIGLSVYYRPNITLPSRSPRQIPSNQLPSFSQESSKSDSLSSGSQLKLPFAPALTQRGPLPSSHGHPFGAIISPSVKYNREESDDRPSSLEQQSDQPSLAPSYELGSQAVAREQDGYIMVDLTDIKPAFAHRSSQKDELSEFLQQCRETPSLDIFSSEQSIDVTAAVKIVEERSVEMDTHTQSSMSVS